MVTVALLITSGCGNDSDGSRTTSRGPVSSTPAMEVPLGSGMDSEPLEDSGFATPVLPDMSLRENNLLTRTFWVAEFWVDHANNGNNEANRGRWWRFEKDGTFSTGLWEDVLANGSWVIYKDQTRYRLHMDANINRFDMEFELQQIAPSETYMSWAGTPTYGMSRIAVKAISLLTQPTKAQFGIE